MTRFFTFLLLFTGMQVEAEMLSIPEACLPQEVAPCLVKSNQKQSFKTHFGELHLDEGVILKVTDFKLGHLELLRGKISLQLPSGKKSGFKLNDIPFESSRVFAEMNPQRKMRVYDGQKFILADYELAQRQGDEAVISKFEFLSKLDMIRYLAGYFSSKTSLAAYLKSIEPAWKNEFKTQTDDQTIVLKRSIASIEKSEAENKRRLEEEARQLKKVRELFFYRTFYR